MRKWTLADGDPLSLTLAVDARFDPVDEADDQVWRLALRDGEPPSLSVVTTYGLRARSMRIFPGFTQAGDMLIDPAKFYKPPRVTQFFPNYVQLTCSPFSGIDVTADYWVPASQALACRMKFTNSSVIPLQARVDWAVLLAPLGEGLGMVHTQVLKTPVLAGQTSALAPVFILPGKAVPGFSPFPSLGIDLDLAPGNTCQVHWACAARADTGSSFDLATQVLGRGWESELSRLVMANAFRRAEIETGDPDLDAVLAFSQKCAAGLILAPTPISQHPSFVLSRQPDRGVSRHQDGADDARRSQTPLEAYLLANVLLPGGSEFLAGILRAILASQEPAGVGNGPAGSSRPRPRLLPTPILAALAWKIYQSSQDKAFLADTFPGLLKTAEAWFQPAHDHNRDGFPEWDHPAQTWLDTHPVAPQGHRQDSLNRIGWVESPALASFLFQEVQCLTKIAELLNKTGEVQPLRLRADLLRKEVEKTWDSTLATYQYRDRDSHLSLKGTALTQSVGPGAIHLDRSFKRARRLQIQLRSGAGPSPLVHLKITGSTSSGAAGEEQSVNHWQWDQHLAQVTTQDLFTFIDRVEVTGLPDDGEWSVRTFDCSQEDISLLLPLWAEIPRARRVKSLVDRTVLNPARYLLPFGLAGCPTGASPASQDPCRPIDLGWNQLVAEGLLAYGYRKEAAGLLMRTLSATLPVLKRRQAFYSQFDGSSGEPSGEPNTLDGLAPVNLFLEILGVHLISPYSVIITGFNPYSWPVTVKYRGLTVVRQEKLTQITFPDGQTASLSGEGHHWVSLV